jgi:hypothetical protein
MPEWVQDRIATALCFLPLVVYFLLFFVRKEVSLPPSTTLALMTLGVAVRLSLIVVGFKLDGTTLVLSILFGVIVLALALTGRRPVFVHAPEEAVRDEIDEACRRLFIQKEEPRRGEIRLTAKANAVTLWLMPQGRSSVVFLLPRSIPPGKLTLFFDWLRKRYPGPIPRIRVNLNRR